MLLSYVRTAAVYLVLIGIIRLMGKRQIGEMEPAELVVAMLTANLAAIPLQDPAVPLLSGLVPVLTVLGMELVLSALSLRFVGLRRLLCGKPVILIENGTILRENLLRTRITLDELAAHLRDRGELSPENVQYAILETSGQVSVFPYPRHRPATAEEAGIPVASQHLPYTLIADGCLYRDNLQLCGLGEAWLERLLDEKNAAVADVWLLTADETGKYVFLTKNPEEAPQ